MTAAQDDEEYDFLREPLPSEGPRPPRSGWTPWRTPWRGAAAALAPTSFIVLVFAAFAPLTRTIGMANAAAAVFVVPVLVAVVVIVLAHPGGQIDRRIARRRAGRLRLHADAPWLGDHPWDPSGVSLSWRGVFLREAFSPRWLIAWGISLSLAALMRPFLWVFPLLGGLQLAFLAARAWTHHGMGDARVSFAGFPYAPGDAVKLWFGMSEHGATFRRAAFRLRHVQELAGGTFNWGRATFENPPLTVHRPPGALPGPNQDVELCFQVPAGAPGTNLLAPLPHYWVLDVVGLTSKGAFRGTFLIPIYEKPAAAAAAA